jgi:hypothetical protein
MKFSLFVVRIYCLARCDSASRCYVTVFSVILFLHLLGAVALFIGYGIEWTASSLFRNASSAEQVRSWLRVCKVSPPLSGAGLGVVLLSGGYLASLSGAMKQGWIPATLIAIFFALLLGFGLILPRMKRIRAALPSGNDPLSAQLRERLSDPVLLTAIRVRVLLVTGIVSLDKSEKARPSASQAFPFLM